MAFQSILFPQRSAFDAEPENPPSFFRDLNLDQAVAAITKGFDDYHLAPFFSMPLSDPESIRLRQEVMQDLEQPAHWSAFDLCAVAMQHVRDLLARREKLHHARQKHRLLLDAAATYCDAHSALAATLRETPPSARALRAFADYLGAHVQSIPFASVAETSHRLLSELGAIRYCVEIVGLDVYVRKPQGEPDYAADVEETFRRFSDTATEDYVFSASNGPHMNYVEGRILDLVADLYPETFSAVELFAAAHSDFIEPTLGRFDREIHFYRAYLQSIAPLKAQGLSFCYPEISMAPTPTYLERGFDLTLAQKLAKDGKQPLANNFALDGNERIIVVTGPNQGGKTTFARMFAQAHYLAALGCPIPGARARLMLVDHIFTHFERGEAVQDLRGKLQDDLLRVHAILDAATSRSIIVLNEIFTSTTLRDASSLSSKILARLKALGLIGVWVTFVEELAAPDPQVVSMVSTVDADDPTKRTFQILRAPAEGRSRALSLAKKHGLTLERIRRRLGA